VWHRHRACFDLPQTGQVLLAGDAWMRGTKPDIDEALSTHTTPRAGTDFPAVDYVLGPLVQACGARILDCGLDLRVWVPVVGHSAI
jgi:hypothetical protein